SGVQLFFCTAMAFHFEVIFIGYIASDPKAGIYYPRTPVKSDSLATVEQPVPPGCKAQIALIQNPAMRDTNNVSGFRFPVYHKSSPLAAQLVN
ncbi:hypothetical protein ACI28K_005025, partial [Escherichia coli]